MVFNQANYSLAFLTFGVFVISAVVADLITQCTHDRMSTTFLNLTTIALSAILGAAIGKSLVSRLTFMFIFPLLSSFAIFMGIGRLPLSFNLVFAFFVSMGASLPILHSRTTIKKSLGIGAMVGVAAIIIFSLFAYLAFISVTN